LAGPKQPNLDDEEVEAHQKVTHVRRGERMGTEVQGPWTEGFRVFRTPHFPGRLDEYKMVFDNRLNIEPSPPPQQPTPRPPLVRPGNIVGILCKFLNALPVMREPDAKLAARAKGLRFSNGDWWDARRQLPKEQKIRGRPKKSDIPS
jgi:hypothetical protein